MVKKKPSTYFDKCGSHDDTNIFFYFGGICQFTDIIHFEAWIQSFGWADMQQSADVPANSCDNWTWREC